MPSPYRVGFDRCARHFDRDDAHVRALASTLFLLTGLAAQGQTTSPQPAQPQQPKEQAKPQRYDPYDGMDFNGRIPKPEFPKDLKRPERWRYTPAARIKPGSMLDRFWVSSFVTPVIFREEDIGFGGGLAMTDIDFLGDNFRQFANIVGTYSAEGQQAYRIFWSKWLNHRNMPGGGIIREERGRVYARLGFEKTLTRRFFGFGSRTPSTNETSYTEEVSYAGAGVRLPLPDTSSNWLLRVDLDAAHRGLSSGRVSSVPSTNMFPSDPTFLQAFNDGDGVDQVWLRGNFGWDSRDSQAQAYKGARLGASIATAYQSGGEFGSIVAVDGQKIIQMPPLFHTGGKGREENPPTDTLAIGFVVQDTIGDLPFYNLPTLGGSRTLRGYIQNRFTDRASAHGTLEYRVNLIERGYAFTDTIRIERIGFALFYDFGTVASDFDALDDARFLDSYGVGLRVAFSREAVFRIDVGYGDEGSNVTIAFGNAF